MTSDDPEAAAMEDSVSVLGLVRKDFLRPLNVTSLDGLNAKQHAYALSGVTERMTSTDVLETGGEMVPGLHTCRCSAVRLLHVLCTSH